MDLVYRQVPWLVLHNEIATHHERHTQHSSIIGPKHACARTTVKSTHLRELEISSTFPSPVGSKFDPYRPTRLFFRRFLQKFFPWLLYHNTSKHLRTTPDKGASPNLHVRNVQYTPEVVHGKSGTALRHNRNP